MLSNYLTVAWRSITRKKGFTAILISGLAVGMACFLLIALYALDEWSYDRFHGKKDRIYRLAEKLESENSSSNPFPVAQALKTDYPHLVEQTVRLFNFQLTSFTLQIGDQKYNETNLYFADSTFFQVFDYALAEGDPQTALARPNSIIVSRAMAKKYFGDTPPLGKILRLEGKLDLMVSGIFAEIPTQSHIRFDALISFSTAASLTGPNTFKGWVWNPCWTYLLLKEGVSPDELTAQFPEFIKKYYPNFLKAQVTHYLQPLTDIHLHSKLDYEMHPNGDAATVWVFCTVGLLILLISCINFTNLATARSLMRAREVGMRKVLGADRKMIVRQFLGESLLISLIAWVGALILSEISLPLLNALTGKNFSWAAFQYAWYIPLGLLVAALCGVLGGWYPSLFLARFDAVTVLKGQFKHSGKTRWLRQTLVVMQFAISTGLIAGTIVVYLQLHYMRSADTGFQKEHILVIPTRPAMIKRYETLKSEWKSDSRIQDVTVMNEILGVHHNTHEIRYEPMPVGQWQYFPGLMVDEDFAETFGLQLLAGRDFSKDFPRDDSLGILVNEAAVERMGWGSPEKAIGQIFETIGGHERVIGVVKNFNYKSLAHRIEPFFIDMPNAGNFNFFRKFMALRIRTHDLPGAIAHIESVWNRIVPEYPCEFSFLDQNIEKMYRAQENLSRIIGYFAGLAIFIACLGMFALASFMAEQRTKEIGIRKTLGARTSELALLFARDFVILVLIAAAVSSLPSAWFMQDWLNNYNFRITLEWWIFASSAGVALLIAALTVSYQAVRTASRNPVKALRYE